MMTIREMVTASLDGIHNAASTKEETEVEKAVAQWLSDCGWFTAECDGELRALALSETNLVEPSADD